MRLTEFAHTGQKVQHKDGRIFKILRSNPYDFKLQHINKYYIVTLSKECLDAWSNLG